VVKAIFVDANATLAAVAERLHPQFAFSLKIHPDPSVMPESLPDVVGDAEIVIIDHTYLPTPVALRCKALKHVVFLGTGPRSYMDPDELARHGIEVHIVKGYGDIAVAEHAIALMMDAARGVARMDREMRAGNWVRTDGVQLFGKTLGLVGFGGIAAQVARIGHGMGMKVLAWNRSPKVAENVSFVELNELLAQSQVVSLHLALNDETRNIINRERLSLMRAGAVLVNTARAALVDQDAMIDSIRAGHVAHAALDVFMTEPLPANDVLTTLPNVTLSAHSAFRTPEANDALVTIAFEHCRRLSSAA
jgi:D-3-phosphoglycerate dehydrogenase